MQDDNNMQDSGVSMGVDGAQTGQGSTQQQGSQPMSSNSPQPPRGKQPSPQVAGDVDLIEKEWVEKAKHIVDQTKADPHVQNKEMNKVKADYLKKRYNKDIKLVEE